MEKEKVILLILGLLAGFLIAYTAKPSSQDWFFPKGWKSDGLFHGTIVGEDGHGVIFLVSKSEIKEQIHESI